MWRLPLLLLFLCGAPSSRAESTEKVGYGVTVVSKATGPSSVTREYYTRMVVKVVKPTFPTPDSSRRRKFVDAFLKAFGSRVDREHVITVTLKPVVQGIELPEQVLITYRMDPVTGVIDATVNDDLAFPSVRLESDQAIDFTLTYRDARSADADFDGLGAAIAGFMPGSSLVSPFTQPFFNQVAKLTGSVLAQLNTATSQHAYTGRLSPGREGTKAIQLRLVTPEGNLIGTVDLSLQARASLARNPVDVFSASIADFGRGDLEDVSTLGFSLAGARKTYLEVLSALPAYLKLVQNPGSAVALREYCQGGRDELGTRHMLTLMDRSQLLYLSLRNAGFTDLGRKTAWYHDCFLPVEQDLLSRVLGLNPPGPAGTEGARLDDPLLYALGCWMMQSHGPECTAKAPRAEEILRERFADEVRVSLDSGFLSSDQLLGRDSLGRDELIAVIKGSARNFRCFAAMIVISATDERAFRLDGVLSNGRLESITVRPASEASANCR